MSFRCDIDALILGVLQLHGYEIAKRINARDETVLRVREGQLYPILHRIENEGLISSEWVQQDGKPARRLYRLTEPGRRQLDTHRESWRKFSESVNSLLTIPKTEASHG
jgi:PadR family transcriptional regulator PadR